MSRKMSESSSPPLTQKQRLSNTLFNPIAKRNNSACLEIERNTSEHSLDPHHTNGTKNLNSRNNSDLSTISINENNSENKFVELHRAKSTPFPITLGFDDLLTQIDNPHPQIETTHFPGSNLSGDKFILVMVGLPARGKTFIARRIRQYLTFFQSTPCELFNVGNYRRESYGAACSHEFFDHANLQFTIQRNEVAEAAMKDLIAWFTNPSNMSTHSEDSEHSESSEKTSRVAIFDATNTTKERRKWVVEKLRGFVESMRQIIFIETICDDEFSEENKKIIEKNILHVKLSMPDYKEMDSKDAIADFKKRIEHYKKVYETIDHDEDDLTYIKLIDGGRKLTMNHIRGFLPGKIVQLLMNLSIQYREIYLTRHGESEYNALGKIGGDSLLSPDGDDYARKLAKYVHKELLGLNEDGSFKSKEQNVAHVRLFTSSLLRTKETAKYIVHHKCKDGWVVMRPKAWRALDEIYAGVFDGMTYEEIKTKAPSEFEQRQKNKLSYRYPRGESYLDVVQRLDPVIHEIERLRDPVLIVAHQGILRIIYSYFMGFSLEDAPFVSIPLNTVIKLIPGAYFCSEQRITLKEKKKQGVVVTQEPPSH